MNITSKSRYALKIMLDLGAPERAGEIVHRTDIAARQGIPLDYMDHILSRLRESGLIQSFRGRGGGYRIGREADSISVLEILTAVEDAFEPVQCLDGGQGCSVEHLCSSRDAWGLISSAIRNSLSGIILGDIVVQKPRAPKTEPEVGADGVQECRAPRRRAAAELQ